VGGLVVACTGAVIGPTVEGVLTGPPVANTELPASVGGDNAPFLLTLYTAMLVSDIEVVAMNAE